LSFNDEDRTSLSAATPSPQQLAHVKHDLAGHVWDKAIQHAVRFRCIAQGHDRAHADAQHAAIRELAEPAQHRRPNVNQYDGRADRSFGLESRIWFRTADSSAPPARTQSNKRACVPPPTRSKATSTFIGGQIAPDDDIRS